MKKITLILSILLMTQFISAQIIHVPADHSTIQAAINAAVDGDTVLVAEGSYTENINFKGKAIMVASLLITDGDTSHVSKTIIDGSGATNPDSATTVVMISGEDSTSVLNGFTITGGKGSKWSTQGFSDVWIVGGGIRIDSSGGKIINNKIEGNSLFSEQYTVSGAGMDVFVGTDFHVVIRNNKVSNNTASSQNFTEGSGINLICHDGFLVCEDNLITGNSANGLAAYAALGGGISAFTVSPWKNDFIIRNNRIINNEISGIYAVGAGIYFYSPLLAEVFKDTVSKLSIYNNLISGNISQHYGGGIGLWGEVDYANAENPNPLIYNNTIVGNKAEYGGGLFNHNSKPLLFNNILWNESTLAPGEELYNGDYAGAHEGSYIAKNNLIQNRYEGVGNFSADPLLDPLTMVPTEASGAIGRSRDSIQYEGAWYYAPLTDLDWEVRKEASADRRPDLGALESSFDRPVPIYDSERVINVPDEESTIQAAIDAAAEGDTVLVDEGIYYENINFRGKAITVASKYIMNEDETHIAQTVIDGSMPVYPDSASVVSMFSGEDTTSIVMGFTITGGKGTRNYIDETFGNILLGGGIDMFAAGGKIVNNIITGNSLYAEDINVFGGGIHFGGNSIECVIRDNQVFDNKVSSFLYAQAAGLGEGGGTNQYLMIEGNMITKNTAIALKNYPAVGGGIFIVPMDPWTSKITIRNNTITENSVLGDDTQGSGIYVVAYVLSDFVDEVSEIEIYNNLIFDNYSEQFGGGISLWGDDNHYLAKANNPCPIIYNNTILGNRSKDGSGIFTHNMRPLLYNNIFFNEEMNYEGEEFYNGGYYGFNVGSFLSFNNLIEDWDAGRWDIAGDPDFDIEGYEFSESSLCIDRGIESVEVNGETYDAPPFDVLGNPRPYAGNETSGVDIGAIETEFVLVDHFQADDKQVDNGGDCNISLTFTIEGGIPPYRVSMDGVEYYSTEIEGLCPGVYDFIVMDTTGAEFSFEDYALVGVDPDIIYNPNQLKVYPNPMAQTGIIQFELEQTLPVRLSIFNLVGQEQVMLLSEDRPAGEHEVQFDASKLKTGVYIVRLVSDKISTCKLIVQ